MAYIVELNKLQEKEGFRFGNKLKMAHIKRERLKMKVKLATKFSVAAFLMLWTTAKNICTYHLTIDAAFDVLNSRNSLGKGYKAPNRLSNKDDVVFECKEAAISYIAGFVVKN